MPTTVISDLVRHLTDLEVLIGLVGNMFPVGFALPQLLVAGYIVPNVPTRISYSVFLVHYWTAGRRRSTSAMRLSSSDCRVRSHSFGSAPAAAFLGEFIVFVD